VRALRERALSHAEIARADGISETSVRRLLPKPALPTAPGWREPFETVVKPIAAFAPAGSTNCGEP
jgi:transposase